MECNQNYFNKKWNNIIKDMPNGGVYKYNLRQYGYNIIKLNIKNKSKVFDYACGLGVIDIQLEKEKYCIISGCDYSKVAIEYIKQNTKGDFRITKEIFYVHDYILAMQFLEHIKAPVIWVKKAFLYTRKIIVQIPNNFKKTNEHINMQWNNLSDFIYLFRDFKLTRLDEGLYPKTLHKDFQHPTFLFEKK